MNRLSSAAMAILTPMLGIAVFNLFFAPRLGRAPRPRALPRVSLLIPARNEAHNLRDHLPTYLATHYTDLEILVLDDESTDGTADTVRSLAPIANHTLTLVSGEPPPPGWLGKNWACHQLSEMATGDILIFCDADVALDPEAVSSTVGAIQGWNADALTAFPRQEFDHWSGAALVPLVAQTTVGALLPLPLVPHSRTAVISVANGQWLAFTRDAYTRCGGHSAVRGEVLEDVELGRAVKRAGLRLVPAIATDLLSVRMYRNLEEVIEGFGKNLFQIAGGRTSFFLGAMGVFLVAGVYPVVGAIFRAPGARLSLAMMAATRVCVALTFRHGAAPLLLHPAGAVLVLVVAKRSFLGSRQGTLRWKDRPLPALSDG